MAACLAFGLTILKAKTEIMCLRTKGMPESSAVFSVKAADQMCNKINELIYLGGDINDNAALSIKVNLRLRNAWLSFRMYTPELYDRPSAPIELKFRMLKVEIETMRYGCVKSNPRVWYYDTLYRTPYSVLICCIGWRKNIRTDRPISYLDTLIETGSENI